MKCTSAEAAKLLRKLNDEYNALLLKEEQSKSFLAAMGEDVESVRPQYDYAETQRKLSELEDKIRKLKHSINLFNANFLIADFNMTIDEMLIYIPQLTKRKTKLYEMKSKLPKTREDDRYGRHSNIIDYRYSNYDIDAVTEDYLKVADQLAKAQTALDVVNNTQYFEIDF